MSQQITLNFRVIREFFVYPADFQQISTLEPNLTTKFVKFCGEIFIIKNATHNVSKKIFFIKIYPRKPEISSIECQKPVKSTENDDIKSVFAKLSGFDIVDYRVKFIDNRPTIESIIDNFIFF
jgi:hypothetical protein